MNVGRAEEGTPGRPCLLDPPDSIVREHGSVPGSPHSQRQVGLPRMFQRRSWVLALCVCFTLSFIFSWLWSLVSHHKAASTASNGMGPEPTHPCWPMARKRKPIPKATELCWELMRNPSTEADPKRVDKDWIIRQFKLVQSCPWMHNASALGHYREQLGRCCNASARLVLTQENTLLGSWIILDGQQTKKLKVQEDLLEILPQGSPFQDPPYECCAVVGNGGILRNSSCGPEIDRAQVVIRFNLPPLGFADDVGTKSSIITLNPSVLQSRFSPFSPSSCTCRLTNSCRDRFHYPSSPETYGDMEAAQEAYKWHVDRDRPVALTLRVGDKVWLSAKHLKAS
ncbi:alpha-2,8-sialyltransferase 8F-like isoform X4 [Emydura macquarii macquarii]|uniref:alpha-2,8-sialyltransferase 8F-like isoform X4 n=1 Tax=Emydura macquarii macquarii TaxID=1129001 RepID=UPI00352B5A31